MFTPHHLSVLAELLGLDKYRASKLGDSCSYVYDAVLGRASDTDLIALRPLAARGAVQRLAMSLADALKLESARPALRGGDDLAAAPDSHPIECYVSGG
jgi:hypothetical protein